MRFLSLKISSTVSILALTLFLLPSVVIADSIEVIVTIFGIAIIVGNDSFSLLRVIPDE